MARPEQASGEGEVAPASSRLRRWCSEMEQDDEDEGRLALTNIIHDLRTERLPRRLIVQFLERVVAEWDALPAPESPFIGQRGRALQSFDTVRRAMNKERTIRCQGTPKITSGTTCSNVSHVEQFLPIIDRTKAGLNYPGGIQEKDLARLERMTVLDPVVSADASVPSGRPMAWVTRADEIERMRKTSTDSREFASKVRAALGLHRDIGEQVDENRQTVFIYYVEVRYPSTVFASDAGEAELKPPTFLDSGPSRVFRSQTTPDGWGQTVNLDGAKPGVPEAVHAPVKARGMQVRRIGQPDREPAFSYRAVVAGAPIPWQSAFVSELEAACTET